MTHAVTTHAANLHLRLHEITSEGPVVSPNDDAHPQLHAAFNQYAQEHANTSGHPNNPNAIIVNTDHAHHLIRFAARLCCLRLIPTTRNDAEGCSNIDVEASSSSAIKRWMHQLTPSDAAWLMVYRCGANYTPTRIFNRSGSTECWFCKARYASMRHFVVECPHFASHRVKCLRANKLRLDSLGSLPRVTTKSG